MHAREYIQPSGDPSVKVKDLFSGKFGKSFWYVMLLAGVCKQLSMQYYGWNTGELQDSMENVINKILIMKIIFKCNFGLWEETYWVFKPQIALFERFWSPLAYIWHLEPASVTLSDYILSEIQMHPKIHQKSNLIFLLCTHLPHLHIHQHHLSKPQLSKIRVNWIIRSKMYYL